MAMEGKGFGGFGGSTFFGGFGGSTFFRTSNQSHGQQKQMEGLKNFDDGARWMRKMILLDAQNDLILLNNFACALDAQTF